MPTAMLCVDCILTFFASFLKAETVHLQACSTLVYCREYKLILSSEHNSLSICRDTPHSNLIVIQWLGLYYRHVCVQSNLP